MPVCLPCSINSGKSDVLENLKAPKNAPKRAPAKPKGALGVKLRGNAWGVNAVDKPEAAAAAMPTTTRSGRGITPTPAALAAGAQGAVMTQTITQRIKGVLEELKRTRNHYTIEQLSVASKLDIAADEELRSELAHHANVEIIADGYRYRPKTQGIRGRDDLLRYLRQQSTVEGAGEKGLVGVKMALLDDAYIGVEDDIKALHKEGLIFKFDHTTIPGDTVLFFNEKDDRLGLNLHTSDNVVALFHDTPVPPNATDLSNEVVKAGLKSLQANRPKLEKLVTEPKEKKRKRTERKINLAKATNAHLPSLFMGDQPSEIDVRD